MNFFTKLVKGKFGLTKTFWIYLALGSFVLNLLAIGIVPAYRAPVFVMVSAIFVAQAYTVAALVGTWNASKTFDGKKVWKSLARGLVIINTLQVVGILFTVISAL